MLVVERELDEVTGKQRESKVRYMNSNAACDLCKKTERSSLKEAHFLSASPGMQ